MENHKQFVNNVKFILNTRGLNISDLAEMTGYSEATIYAFTHGSRKSVKCAEAIAKALNISY